VVGDAQPYTVHATLAGEPIAPERHHMRVDVKAVTLHRFSLTQTQRGWEATVVLDI
jgi:protein archease